MGSRTQNPYFPVLEPVLSAYADVSARLGDHSRPDPGGDQPPAERDRHRARPPGGIRPQHPAALESLKQVALIQSVEASNAIENITAPRRRLEELVAQQRRPAIAPRPRSPATGPSSTPSTRAHRDIPFTPNVVRQLHRDLYQFAAQPGGDWKGSDNLVTEERPDGIGRRPLHTRSRFETPAAMDELHRALRRGLAGRPASPPPARRRLHARLPRHPPLRRRQRAHVAAALAAAALQGRLRGRALRQPREADRAEQGDLLRRARPARPPAGTRAGTTCSPGSRTSSASSPPPTASSSRAPKRSPRAAAPRPSS